MCKMQSNLDEELIREVEHHAVIYNRQKYFVNNSGAAGQFETKDDAWETIAKKLGSDVETCKKRWKYLRERYVQQLKNYPPTFEHLSRPYLERMKFLDQHIQPRKSFRSVFLPSPKSQYVEYMDSRSNGSIQNNYSNYPESVSSSIKVEPTFPNFHSSDDPSPNDHRSVSQPSAPPASSQLNEQAQNLSATSAGAVRESTEPVVRIPSSSSSLKSPLSSPPQVGDNHHRNNHHEEMNENMKRPRLATSLSQRRNDSSDDEMLPSRLTLQRHLEHQHEQHQMLLNDRMKRTNYHADSSQMTNSDLMQSLYQRFAPSNQVRCSEQLLGELVTSELLKMSKEKRKVAQRRILEILFFDD